VEEESMGERRDGGLLHIVRRHEASTGRHRQGGRHPDQGKRSPR
jgi:hypothetical protein